MTVTESRLKTGKLILGPTDTPVLTISCQATAVTLEPSFNEGDAVEVLCGDNLSGDASTTWALKFTGIQDFSDPKGFVNYSYDNDGSAQPFTWTPNEDTGPTYSGTVTVRAVLIGGDVNKRITTDAEWPCNGKPQRTDKAPPAPSRNTTPAATTSDGTTSG